jgi:hypothetical protein
MEALRQIMVTKDTIGIIILTEGFIGTLHLITPKYIQGRGQTS